MEISIVIPVYNSSKILKSLLENIFREISKFSKHFEVILVNDFSNDNSWNEIKKLKKKYNFIKGLNLKKNYGQHSAIFCGLKHAIGQKVVCMDDDMQHDPCHIFNMLDQLKKFDVCYVKYIKREHNIIKVLISKLNNIISSYLMNKSMKIYTSSFKCFKKNVRDEIILNNDNFIFLDYWILKYTKNITSVNVTHNKRLEGKTNYGFRELLTLWSNMIFLIEEKKISLRYLIVLLIKYFFKIFFKSYIKYSTSNKIEISEKI